MIGFTHSVALLGINGAIVAVEADVTLELGAAALVGLPDAALGETRDRVRSAITNSPGLIWPERRAVINLSPVSLPKHGSHHDLAIALALLAASGQVSAPSLSDVHVGELGLDGRVRPMVGVLAAVMEAARAGFHRIVVPAANLAEAQLVDGIEAVGVATLAEAARLHGASVNVPEVDPVRPYYVGGSPRSTMDGVQVGADLINAAMVAASGGHHVSVPEAGAESVARILAEILPDLGPAEALDVTAVQSLVGMSVTEMVTRPPLEAPHYTVSAAAMVGGGAGIMRPGAMARANHGVLFLESAPEFSVAALDAMRQPLESGVITISRASASARFGAQFQLVLGIPPCPCGMAPDCGCTPQGIRRYRARLSGPIMDRIDIRLGKPVAGVLPVMVEDTRQIVVDARARAAERLKDTPWRVNAQVAGTWLRSPAGSPLPGSTAGLDRQLERGGITMRGYDRVLRMAWTHADLQLHERPTSADIGLALQLRNGQVTR